MKTISPAALRRLQIVYRQYEAHSLDVGGCRQDRLTWASATLGRRVDSFSTLTPLEGKELTDGLQNALGLKETAPARRYSRKDGEKAGTEGRSDQLHPNESTLVGDKDVRRIQQQLTRLGWDQGRLEAFLLSPRGPNGGRKEIRTLGDANRIYWALKGMKPSPTRRSA